MSYIDKYNDWCKNEYFDIATKEELLSIKDEKEIEDRFYKELEFGTGGLRGVMGAGTNRMNIYTVRKATQGLADYINKTNGSKKVAIAFDSRNNSSLFAKEAALCLNANNITTYIFESLRPTPELSFAVRELNCIAGIVITASHNPKEYNGYKVYWEDGAQITPPHDKNIMECVSKVVNFNQVKTMDEMDSRISGLYNVIGTDFDKLYQKKLMEQSINPDIVKKISKDIKIVYSPLHGSGGVPVLSVLKKMGFENVYVVEEQKYPDGNFPTVSYPNPEDKNAWKCGLELAKKVNADIILATDPDADRLGIYAKEKNSDKYVSFTGNMSGTLIAQYILKERTRQNIMPSNPTIVETIVSTDMIKAIAQEYQIKVIEVLTGFKFIGEQIKIFEDNKSNSFIFGMEESYGCLAGTYARDKDACVAVMLLCEVAAYYKLKNMTLIDAMNELYKKYGYYMEDLKTITLKGIEGEAKIKSILDNMRCNPPQIIGGKKVLECKDYLINSKNCPKSNVLYYVLENNSWCCLRPSGTEPKIKFYVGTKGENKEEAQSAMSSIINDLLNKCK